MWERRFAVSGLRRTGATRQTGVRRVETCSAGSSRRAVRTFHSPGAIFDAASRGGPNALGWPWFSYHSWCLGMIKGDARLPDR